MELPNFLGGSYLAQSPIVDQERTVNLYYELTGSPGASGPGALYPTPGVTRLSLGATSPGKANFWDQTTERQFVVLGNKLVEVDSAGVQTVRGTVATDANPATISSNGTGGDELFITSGGNGYVYDLPTNTLTQIAALNGKATMGDFIDGYFLALDGVNGTVYSSELLDGTTWTTGTDFFSPNCQPIGMKVKEGLVYLLGAETGEVWYNAGDSPVPFVRTSGGTFSYGIVAPFSLEIVSGALYWLGRTINGQGQVLRATGQRPEVVSNTGLENEFSTYATLSDAIAETYDDRGHTFYILTFPEAAKTWGFDPKVPAPMAWHERSTRSSAGVDGAWRPMYHAFAFGQHRMLDIASGGIYRMSSALGSDVDSLEIVRVRQSPALMKENMRLFYPCFELGLEPGLGLQSGQGSNPMVMLQMSNDGGKTWGAELWRATGKVGQYGRRVRWLRCGSARKRVFRVTFSDPVPFRLIGAWLPNFEEANAMAA